MRHTGTNYTHGFIIIPHHRIAVTKCQNEALHTPYALAYQFRVKQSGIIVERLAS